MKETALKILGIFKEYNVDVDQCLLIQVFLEKRDKWSRPHKNAFNSAIEELIEEKYIYKKEDIELSYCLTKKGYDYIYNNR